MRVVHLLALTLLLQVLLSVPGDSLQGADVVAAPHSSLFCAGAPTRKPKARQQQKPRQQQQQQKKKAPKKPAEKKKKIDLYGTLGLKKSASEREVKKLSLIHI